MLALFRSNEYTICSFNYLLFFEVLCMDGYMTAFEAAEKWGVTQRQVQILCNNNRVDGAMRMSRMWIIPRNAEKPTAGRRNSSQRRQGE